jgi:hypothetical protein
LGGNSVVIWGVKWDPDLAPGFGTLIWDPDLGPRFGTPIWDPDLEGDMGPRFFKKSWSLSIYAWYQEFKFDFFKNFF